MKLSHISFFVACSVGQAFAFQQSARTSHNTGLHLVNDENTGDEGAVAALQDRRAALGSMAAAAFGVATSILPGEAAKAVTTPKKKKRPRVYFKGKVAIKEGESVEMGTQQALFISARPKNPTSIPPEVVRSARGGVPAVFFAVVQNPSFPARFELTENDITPEGDFGLTSDPYWWAEESEWEISARVDSDGIVRTLDATDLVGRTLTSQTGEGSPDADVTVSVKERGFFGSYYQEKN